MELWRWKWRTKNLKFFCYRDTANDWLLIHLLPWLLPIIFCPSESKLSIGPYLMKDFYFELTPWFFDRKKLALGALSSLISTLLIFSLKSACLSAASLTKLLLNRFFPFSSVLLLELDLISGKRGTLLRFYGFFWGVFCVGSASCVCSGGWTMRGASLTGLTRMLGYLSNDFWEGCMFWGRSGESEWSLLSVYRECWLSDRSARLKGPWLLEMDINKIIIILKHSTGSKVTNP